MSGGASSDNLLLFAVRAPTAGETKTRLGHAIGMEPAARLYQAFLTDLAARFTPVAGVPSAYDLGWAFTPAETDYRALLRDLGHPQPEPVRFVPQEGEGWGARQANLLRWGHDQGYAQTVLVASDSPHLDPAIPGLAFAALEGHDVVFGRVRDGGYYLIGLRGMHEVLSGVPMGTAAAADALVARIAVLGLSAAETPPTFDVDEECDLDLLRAELAPDGAVAPATWAALAKLGPVAATSKVSAS